MSRVVAVLMAVVGGLWLWARSNASSQANAAEQERREREQLEQERQNALVHVATSATPPTVQSTGNSNLTRDGLNVVQRTIGQLPGAVGLVVTAATTQGIVTGEVTRAVSNLLGLDDARTDAAVAGANLGGLYSPGVGLIAAAGAAGGSFINTALGGGNQVGVDGNDDLRTFSSGLAGATTTLAAFGPLGWVSAALAWLGYGIVSWVGDENELAHARATPGREAEEWEAGVRKFLTDGIAVQDKNGALVQLGLTRGQAEQCQAAANQALARRWFEEGPRGAPADPRTAEGNEFHAQWALDRAKFKGRLVVGGGGRVQLPGLAIGREEWSLQWETFQFFARGTQAFAVSRGERAELGDAAQYGQAEARRRRVYSACQAYVSHMNQPHGAGLDDAAHLAWALERGLFEGQSTGSGRFRPIYLPALPSWAQFIAPGTSAEYAHAALDYPPNQPGYGGGVRLPYVRNGGYVDFDAFSLSKTYL